MTTDLARRALYHAIGQIGVHEQGGPNRGPEVDDYLRTVGLDPAHASYPWCVAFVHWSFQRAANEARVTNPFPRTASVFRAWERGKKHWASEPMHGAVFVLDHNDGVHGHMGFVVGVGDKLLATVEGNTNAWGGREGNCVALRTRDPINVVGYLHL
jgi:hypothetical protein